MLCASRRDRIRKFGEPGLAHEVDVLDLDVAGGAARRVQQDVDAAAVAIADFAGKLVIARKTRDEARGDRRGNRAIGVCRY